MSEFPLKDYSSPTTLTITLNSLGIGAIVTATTNINNTSTARYDDLLIELILGSVTATTSALDAALIPSIDGTNFQTNTTFPVGSDGTPLAYAYVDTGTSIKRAYLRFKGVAPMQYRLMVRNGLGVAFAASGNSATWRGSLRETR